MRAFIGCAVLRNTVEMLQTDADMRVWLREPCGGKAVNKNTKVAVVLKKHIGDHALNSMADEMWDCALQSTTDKMYYDILMVLHCYHHILSLQVFFTTTSISNIPFNLVHLTPGPHTPPPFHFQHASLDEKHISTLEICSLAY